MPEADKNSSHEFKKSQIKQMIEHQQSVYNWQFTFLGANQNAFAEAANLGIAAQSTANFVPQATTKTFDMVGQSVSRMRHASASNEQVANTYTDEERRHMQGN